MKQGRQRAAKKTSSMSLGEPLAEVDFHLYGEALKSIGVSDGDAERHVSGCREAFLNGPRKTKLRILDVVTSALDAVTQPKRDLEPVRATIETEGDMKSLEGHGSPERR